MNAFIVKRIMLGLAVTAMVAGGIAPAAAQGESDAASTVATAASGTTAKQTRAERKAVRKQERKLAREKRNAELKKLEDAGYQPGKSNPNYPADVKNAQKKAGTGSDQ